MLGTGVGAMDVLGIGEAGCVGAGFWPNAAAATAIEQMHSFKEAFIGTLWK